MCFFFFIKNILKLELLSQLVFFFFFIYFLESSEKKKFNTLTLYSATKVITKLLQFSYLTFKNGVNLLREVQN